MQLIHFVSWSEAIISVQSVRSLQTTMTTQEVSLPTNQTNSLPLDSATRNISQFFDVNFFISIILLQFAFIVGIILVDISVGFTV